MGINDIALNEARRLLRGEMKKHGMKDEIIRIVREEHKDAMSIDGDPINWEINREKGFPAPDLSRSRQDRIGGDTADWPPWISKC